MIKPDALWALFKTCDDDAWLGRICRSLGGQDVKLDPGQKNMTNVVKQAVEWYEESVDNRRKQKRDWWNKHKLDKLDTLDTLDKLDGLDKLDTIRPSVHPSVHPVDTNINRSVPLGGEGGKRNGTGTVDLLGEKERVKRVLKCSASLSADQSAVFDVTWDVPTLCAVVTGDTRSARRWGQLARLKGDDAVRGEIYAFLSEMNAGEVPTNRGAALNKRLGDLKDLEVK